MDMKKIGLVAALAGAALVSTGAAAKPAAAPGLTGMWDYQGRAGGSAGMASPPVTPVVKAMLDKRRTARDKGAVRSIANLLCLPTGFPVLMQWKSPIEILESAGRVTVISEHDPGNDEPRTIYMTKKTPADLAPSWNGYSTGAWSGKTLVVTTVGFNDRAPLLGGVPRTDKTKIVERFSLQKGGKVLEDQLTMTDPTVLTAPWVVTLLYARMPADAERLEAVCEPDLEALKITDLKALKGLDPDADRLLDPALQYNPGSH
jgi:hypothetical protein